MISRSIRYSSDINLLLKDIELSLRPDTIGSIISRHLALGEVRTNIGWPSILI